MFSGFMMYSCVFDLIGSHIAWCIAFCVLVCGGARTRERVCVFYRRTFLVPWEGLWSVIVAFLFISTCCLVSTLPGFRN